MKLPQTLTAITAAGLFACLASYSLGKYGIYETQEHGYSQQERDAMTSLIERETAEDYLSVLEVSLYAENGEAL